MRTDAHEPEEPTAPQWSWVVAIWTGLGLFDGTQNVVVMRAEGMEHAWVALFFYQLLTWLPWLLVTPLVFRLVERRPPGGRLTIAEILPHVATCLAICLVGTAWTAAIHNILNPFDPGRPPPPWTDLWFALIPNHLLSSVILYGCVLLGAVLLVSRERVARERLQAARLAEHLTKARLDALRKQIAPHFLFNALNAVAGLVRAGEHDRAIETIASIGDFLRNTLQEGPDHEVALEDELRFANMYLGIQKTRFDERLQVELTVAPEIGRALVPGLILQPIVENAIEHGIAQRVQGGTIRIDAQRQADRLALTVDNDGPCLAPERDPTVGLANVRGRLQALYGADAVFGIADRADRRGVRVSISLPFRIA